MSDTRPAFPPCWTENPYRTALGDRDVMAALVETPELLRAVAGRMTPYDFARSYGPGKWTAAQLFQHLAQTEAAFGLRVRMALTTPGYVAQLFDQDAWMAREPGPGGSEAFRAYHAMRQWNLALYRSLTPDDLALPFHHPERGEMRVAWILEMLAGHERHHLKHFDIVLGAR